MLDNDQATANDTENQCNSSAFHLEDINVIDQKSEIGHQCNGVVLSLKRDGNPKKKNRDEFEITSTTEPDANEVIDMSLIRPFSCKKPRFLKSQNIISKAGNISLDDQNSLILRYNVLNNEELQNYLEGASKVRRFIGKSAYNSLKPRREICYTLNGEPFKYSGIHHITKPYPKHVLSVIPKFLSELNIVNNPFQCLSNAADALYGPEFEGGGKVGAHGDCEMDWGLVIIYSLGQTRWLRLRDRSKKQWHNIEMSHNSLVAMYGKTFQKQYTHQVDRLAKEDTISYRHSCNIRFLEGPSNISEVNTGTK